MPEKQKRSKSHYVKHAKKPKPNFEGKQDLHDLKQSSQGVLATANFLDYGCKREVFSLLKDFTEEKEKSQVTDQDIDNAIAEEIKDLKKENKRFHLVDCTLNNIMFIAVNDDKINTCELVHKILCTLSDNKQRKTRFTQRLLPVSHTCYASLEDITKTAKVMLGEILHTKTPKTFGIIFKSRNNSSISRDTIIKTVATIATDDDKFAEFNKVDLDNPEYAIVINIIKTIAFMGVLKDFKRLSKYNIDELTKTFGGQKKENTANDENDSTTKISSSDEIKTNTSADVVEKETSDQISDDVPG